MKFFCINVVLVKLFEFMELFIEILDEVLIVILEFQNLIVDEGEFVIFICKIKGLLGMFRLLRCEK